MKGRDAGDALTQPHDALYLWWLGMPQSPVLIGDLRFVPSLRGVSLQYDAQWLAHGFALSEDLPLLDQVFLPLEKDKAPGAVDDARPDRWGERVIRLLDRPVRLSLMEFLLLAGDERFGALGVSVSREVYLPRRLGPMPRLQDVDAIHELVQRVMAGQAVGDEFKRLIAPGVTMGGARPKALIDLDGASWVIKFAEAGEDLDWPLIEHAAMTLAAQADMRVAQTRAIALKKGHAVAVRRFDRLADEGGSRRVHALSAYVALRAAGEEMGYPELAQLLRRRGVVRGGKSRAQMQELFRRMVFNILIDNTDDHEKNHVLLMNDSGEYELAPAFDVLPTGQALGYQQMRVGRDGAVSSLDNALSETHQFGLNLKEAQAQARQVAHAVSQWQTHFLACGVRAADIDLLAAQIDRADLMAQRTAALRG
jgi:serine/threonine-protein kinase HipA